MKKFMWPIWILLIVVNTGCNTMPIKDSTSDEQRFSEFNHLRVNAERAKVLAESAERKVRDGWAYLNWTKANDQISDIGSYKDNMTGKTMVVRKGTTNEYYGEGSDATGYSFGCDYTFGPDKGIGYIGRHCGQSKGGLFDGWVTFEQMGRIVFLEYHNGKMNGSGLTCECRSKGCSEVVNCKDQWYSENKLTDAHIRNYPLPDNLTAPIENGLEKTEIQATKPGAYYVKENILEIRLSPSDSGSVTNRIYRRQKVDVFEVQNRWARISKYYDGAVEGKSGQVARWVLASGLSSSQPVEFSQQSLPNDPRIAKDAFASLNGQDTRILYKGAVKFLNSGTCARVDEGDASVNRPGTYYIRCDGSYTNIYFTPNDVQ